MNNEQRLIAGCKRGETWAIKEIYEKYASAMLSLCFRYTVDRETAKDIMQEGFVKLFTKINQFEGTGAFSAWVRQIFVNTALEYLTRNHNYRMNVSMESISDSTDEFDPYLVEQVSADDLIECIAELPERSRIVFNLYAIEGYTYAEIASKLGIQENSARAVFSRARRLVQKSVLNLMKK